MYKAGCQLMVVPIPTLRLSEHTVEAMSSLSRVVFPPHKSCTALAFHVSRVAYFLITKLAITPEMAADRIGAQAEFSNAQYYFLMPM